MRIAPKVTFNLINEYVAEYQKNLHPFVWTANADDILRKIAKIKQLQETGE